jgi:hypothetical protein
MEIVYFEDHSKNIGINGRIILKWILRNGVRVCEMDSFDPG